MDDLNQENPNLRINIEEEPEPSNLNISDDERTWGTLSHISGLVGLIIPMGSVLAPLIIWLTKGKESRYVEIHSKNALNFQLSMFIYLGVSALLCMILIGIPMLIFFAIAWIVLTIIGTLKASEGALYRYRFNMNLIK
jgi:uncharacterized Tic20 family protein